MPDPQRTIPTDTRAAEAELTALLTSGLFDRAPSLSRFLQYICKKYFAGEADEIKEYNIAVEALGRSPDFDHTRDSIVRVEAYRLRKRLKQFYESEGLDHQWQIVIPSGQYVPRFVPLREATAARLQMEQDNGASAAPSAGGPEMPEKRGGITRRWVTLGLGIVLAIMVAALWIIPRRVPHAQPLLDSSSAWNSSLAVRFRVGDTNAKGRFVDNFGRVWVGDRYFSGGEAVETPPPQELLGLPGRLFQQARLGSFRYDIPLAPGVYELRLFFANTGPAPGSVFDVVANGETLLDNFNITRDAGGPGIAEEKVFAGLSPDQDGYLHLEFGGEGALLHGIEIIPGRPERMWPVRILAGRSSNHHGPGGNLWVADRYFRGGRVASRSHRIHGATDPNLFSGERYGQFSYRIPVTPGSYAVKLVFAEMWFKPGNPDGGGEGSRVFNVSSNAVTLLENFDIYREAGGANRAVVRTFHGLKPDSHGRLVLMFSGVVVDACVSAIEVIPEK